MNATHSPLRGLYWKETRQVLPLVWMLLGVSTFLMVAWSGFSFTSQALQLASEYIPLLLPGLYAAGVGAILVGQEKETRTLLWFGSLPISPFKIVLSKLVVGLGGLLSMWLCCLLLAAVTSKTAPQYGARLFFEGETWSLSLLFWFVHSLYLMFCGFYTSWRLKNAFNSLLLLLPLATIPTVIVQMLYLSLHGVRGGLISISDSAGITIVVTLLCTLLFAVLGWRAAIKSMSPAEPEGTSGSIAEWLSAWRPPAIGQNSDAPFRYSLSSLVWQSIHHNRLALGSLTLLIVVGLVALAYLVTNTPQRVEKDFFAALMSGLTFAGMLGMSWMGVYAFSGDGSATRLRFLADRGVSPTLVWLSRHLIGFSAISFAILLYGLWIRDSNQKYFGVYEMPIPSVAMMACLAWIVYGVSQWTSQSFRILAASAFIAPILSGLAIGWLGFAAFQMDSPFWLLLLCGTLPLVNTWWSMQRYMDDSTRWPMWLASAVGVSLFLLLPIGLLAVEVLSVSTMSNKTRRTLLSQANATASTLPPAQSMMQTRPDEFRHYPMDSLTGEQATKISEQKTLSPENHLLLGDNSDLNIPLAVDSGILSTAIDIATYLRMQLESAPEDEASVIALGEWIETMTSMARRLRLSSRWVDQEAADEIEIWLTYTLSLESLRTIRDRDFSQAAVEMLVDQKSRSDARRRAVLASWIRWRSDDTEQKQTLGQLHGEFLQWLPPIKQIYMKPRVNDAIVAAAIEMIDVAETGGSTESQRRRLHELTVGPTIAFADGPYSDRLRVGADGVTSMEQTLSYPANQWYAKWESDAKELSSLRSDASARSESPTPISTN